MSKYSFLDNLKGLFFWQGWHPEVALRYLSVVTEIKKLAGVPTVLDVGSGGLGIAPYLRFPLTGVDIKFYPPYHPDLERIKASALSLPFADNVFDVVTSVDTLEHLKQKDRSTAISEMLRVAKKIVIIAVPCGQAAYQQDVILSNYYQKVFHKKFPYLEEQLKFGLPEIKDIEKAIYDFAKFNNLQIRVKILRNENLKLRKFLMTGWMSKNIVKQIFFRKIMLLVLPIMVHLNKEPVYRRIFIIKKI